MICLEYRPVEAVHVLAPMRRYSFIVVVFVLSITFTSIFNTSHHNYFGNELFGFTFVSGNLEIHCNF